MSLYNNQTTQISPAGISPATQTRSRYSAMLMAAAILLGVSVSLNAATVTWGTATNISGDSDVSTTGSLVGAFNVGTTGVASTVVNGVTFNPLATTGLTVTSGNFTLSGNALSGSNAISSGAAPFTNLSSGYKSLLSSIGGNGNNTDLTLSMGGLSVGSTYQFQSWYDLSIANGFSFTSTLTSGNVVTLNNNTTALSGGLGQFATGLFTADATTQNIVYNGASSNGLNGFQLRDITPAAAFWKGDVNGTWSTNSASNTNWATAQNGTTDTTVLPGPTTDVTFSSDSPANQTTTLGSNFNIKSLTVNDTAGVTIGGANTLTIADNNAITVNSGAGLLLTINTSGLVLSGATPTIAVNGASTSARINSGLGAGTASLTKTGIGNLIFAGTNTYAGQTTVKAGTLTVTGSITHTGANMVVGDSSGDNGFLTIGNAGSVSNNFGYIANGIGSQGYVQVNNTANWTNASELYVGYQGIGTLQINDSATVSDTKSFIGVLAGSTGEVDVAGGSWSNTGEITVGYQGSGSLFITGGTASSAGGYVGYDATSDNNTVEIQNTGSAWTSTATFHLGYEGSGNTVKVYDGGKLDVQGADAIIGYNGGANDNKLTVTGAGSTFINNATFYVGRSGTGNQLEVLNGAVVTSKNVRIGGGTGSNGTTSDNSAKVDGTGSTWNISGTLRVGSNGDNTTLTVQNGGLVTVTGNSFLGYDAVSDNNKVNIAGTGSTMTAAALVIGRLGTNNTVTVDSGGKLTSTAITLAEQAGSSGTLQIGNGGAAGIIDAPSINGVGGTAVVNFNHTDSDYFFTSDGTSGGTGIAINGTTSVNLNGTGKTTFTGTSAYTGNTAVNAGFLAVNGSLGNTAVTVASGATLGGSGTIGGSVTVLSGGTIAAGNSPGILTVGSLTLNSGSTSTFEINGTTVGTQYDQIVVNGAAALDGTLNLVFGLGYTPTNGDSFTLIDATSITGDFATIVNPLGNAIVYTTTITDDYVLTINAVQTAFTNFALTRNQKSMTRVLDKEFSEPGLLGLINKLNSLPGSELPDAFNQITAEELLSMPNTTLANARALHNQLGNRFREIRSGQNFSANGLTLSDPSRMWKESPNSFLADTGTAAPAGFKMLQPAVQPDRNFGVFVSGQGVIGDFDGDNQVDGFDFTTGGMSLGMDYRVGPQTTVGVYAGYQGTDANLASGSESKSDSAKFGVYGTHDFKQGSWLTASIGGGVHSYDTERNVLGTKATGSTNGREISTQFGLGHDFKAGQFTFGPEANLAYTHLWIDGFTESGSLAPLNIQDQDADSMRSMIGGRVSYDWNWKSLDMTLRPFANIGWQHEFMDDGQAISASFANGAGGVFNAQGASADRDSIVAGAGASLLFSEQWALNLGYAAEANSDYEIHQINGSLNFSF